MESFKDMDMDPEGVDYISSGRQATDMELGGGWMANDNCQRGRCPVRFPFLFFYSFIYFVFIVG